MQITDKTMRPLTEAKYLNADNVSRYRAIMRIFLMHYDKLKYKLYQEDVYEAMQETGLFADYRIEQCRQDLDMLTEWKNLEAYQDTRRVASIEEFKNKKFEYSMTDVGVEVERLVQRLEKLKAIIRDKEAAPECKFTLSTIHASKGLEYDTVYLMDVVDGILPETVPKNLRAASREELEIYEEERRLFYVGATRAKSQLFLFTMNKQASFCSELLGRPIRPGRTLSAHPEISHGAPLGVPSGGRMSGTNYYLTGGSNASEEKYRKLSAQLGAGLLVVHKKFGEGVVVDMDENNVKIRFGDIERILNIRTVAGSGLLKVRK